VNWPPFYLVNWPPFYLANLSPFFLGELADFLLGELVAFLLGELAAFFLGELAAFFLGELAAFLLGELAAFLLGDRFCRLFLVLSALNVIHSCKRRMKNHPIFSCLIIILFQLKQSKARINSWSLLNCQQTISVPIVKTL
jgi:hypothetical protein